MNKQYLIDLIFKTHAGSVSVSKASQLISEVLDSKNDKLDEITIEWNEAIERNIQYTAVLFDILENYECGEDVDNKIKKVMRDVK